MIKNIRILSVMILAFGLSYCSSNENLSGIEQRFNVATPNNQLEINEDDPVLDDDHVSVGETFNGPVVEPDTVASGDSNDNDGDGIPNDEDHLPDYCTEMVVTSIGVSSARIELNQEELYSPNDFKNSNFTDSSNVNLKDGENTIFIRLTGSPGDQLNVRFYNCSEDPVELLFETTVTRTAGPPNTN